MVFFFLGLIEKSFGYWLVLIMNCLVLIIYNGRNGIGVWCMCWFKVWIGGFYWLLDFGFFDLEICDGCECFLWEILIKLERKNLWMVKCYIIVKYWWLELSVYGIELIF